MCVLTILLIIIGRNIHNFVIVPSELPLATIGLYLPIRRNLTISTSDKMGAPVETSLQVNLSKCTHVTYYGLYTQPSKCIVQWNLPILVTLGPDISGLNKEVVAIQ